MTKSPINQSPSLPESSWIVFAGSLFVITRP